MQNKIKLEIMLDILKYIYFPVPGPNIPFFDHSSSHSKNIVISPNFLVWKFCGKAQFPHSFGQEIKYDFFAVSVDLKRNKLILLGVIIILGNARATY